jgi:hypothetical protein
MRERERERERERFIRNDTMRSDMRERERERERERVDWERYSITGRMRRRVHVIWRRIHDLLSSVNDNGGTGRCPV